MISDPKEFAAANANDTMRWYPPFDPDASCAKCGELRVNSLYEHAEWIDPDSDYRSAIYAGVWSWTQHPERIRRWCSRCGYKWYESVLDKDEGKE